MNHFLTHISRLSRHFFHIVSNIRPIIWIGLYLCLIPIFALIYQAMPAGQFRIPEGGGTDFGSWLYYSIVTITTLGFGDYTPMHVAAQAVTAIEVMCGLLFLGFFLNAVGSMKSEIDVESEYEKQRLVHEAGERDKLLKNIPIVLHKINRFLSYCYAVTTPLKDRATSEKEYNPDFTFQDMCDLYYPSGLPFDNTVRPAVEELLKSASDMSLFLDSLQSRVDMTIWPRLMEESFSFVANTQMFDSTDSTIDVPAKMIPAADKAKGVDPRKVVAKDIANWQGPAQATEGNPLNPVIDLYFYIKSNADIARAMEIQLTKIASSDSEPG